MVVIGIIGGVASGKSLVSRQFEQLGAAILDADEVGHKVLRDDDVKQAIRHRWGEAVFNPQGEVDRAAVAKIVFGPAPRGAQELAFLEQFTHPRIEQYLQRRRDELSARGETPVAVLDAALIVEAGWDKYCDCVVFVEAPRALRLSRARQRGWDEAEFAAREAAQCPLDEKQRRADITIENGQSTEQTMAQVQQCWQRLT